jgi:hypothetical protein
MEAIMRAIRWLCSTLVLTTLLCGSSESGQICPPANTDNYSLEFVKSAFEFFKDAATRPTWEFEARRYTNNSPSLGELGDSMSIAVLKIYGREQLGMHENASVYLNMVRVSFGNASRVREQSNREPQVTLLVLDYLEAKESLEAGLEKRIAYMKGCVRDFSCSPQGEAHFFGLK